MKVLYRIEMASPVHNIQDLSWYKGHWIKPNQEAETTLAFASTEPRLNRFPRMEKAYLHITQHTESLFQH